MNTSCKTRLCEQLIVIQIAFYIRSLLWDQMNSHSVKYLRGNVPYSAKFWQGKTLTIRLFQSLARENVGKFTIPNVSYFSESRIWLGKILVNGIWLSLSLLCFQFYLLFLPEFPIIFTHYSNFIPMPSPVLFLKWLLC